MAWQRKHRPKKIEELHLTEVREAFQQMMKQGHFPQVLLFAGPKGTGKTSASRIIGNVLNDPQNVGAVDVAFFGASTKAKKFKEPDSESDFARRIYDGNSYVVQEMDAASYRGIDDVRSLKERVMLPPQEGKIAVYILDEVHMFTSEAFNALLKLLEEPPAHAVFILATTELHKIPETIISRSTKIDFRKATHQELVRALQFVIDREKVTYDEQALDIIADRADGSFRDAVKLLELVAKSGSVSLQSVEAALGQNVEQFIHQLIEKVLAKDSGEVSQIITHLREKNIQEQYFYKRFFAVLHHDLMVHLGAAAGESLVSEKIARFLLQELLKSDLQQYSPIPFLPLELKLLELIERSQNKQEGSPQAKKKIKKSPQPLTETVISSPPTLSPSAPAEISSSPPSLPTEIEAVETVENIEQLSQALLEQWEEFLQVVYQRNATLAALLRSSKLLINADGVPQVGVYYKFHQEQLQQRKHMALIQDCAKDVVGASLPLQIALQKPPTEAALVEVEEDQDLSQLAEEALM